MRTLSQTAIPHHPSMTEDEHRRKRVRKGTRSCWECKRRKIKCEWSSDETIRVCSGCLARGTNCLSQEFPEEYDSSSSTQVGERLGRIELSLQKLLAKVESYEGEEATLPTPDSISNDLTPFPGSGASNNDSAPVFSLFDNGLIGRRETSNAAPTQMATPVSSGSKTPSCRPLGKLERIRQSLVELLPSQHDSDMICEGSNSWLLVHAVFQHLPTDDISRNNSRAFVTFNIAEVAKGTVTRLARTLLFLAVCLQQMPKPLDLTRLQLSSQGPSIEARVDKILAVVGALVTSDDELISGAEGLECLILQGLFHTNAGNLRRGWLTFRRALNVGQLMGVHKNESIHTIPGGKAIWYQIVRADRYLALLLGLPAGSGDDGFEPQETFQNPELDKDQLFLRKLSILASRIINRNQAEFTNAFATTQEIDERLDSLGREMPKSWWETPLSISTDQSIGAIEFDRMMIQIWYYQLESLLHLPFMLKAATERRYDYSKFSCLKASRELIFRYLSLRRSEVSTFCCKAVDFSAFTATVTILLSLLEPALTGESQETVAQRESDRALVQTVQATMEELSDSSKDTVATQSSDVIKTLLKVDSCAISRGNIRLTIPYFGTINIAPNKLEEAASSSPNSLNKDQGSSQCGTPMSSLAMNPPPTSNPQNITTQQPLGPPTVSTYQYPHPFQTFSVENVESLTGQYTEKSRQASPQQQPVISFTSSQFQFPPFPDQTMEDWALSQGDNTLIFDSLLGSDIEGGWIF